VFIRGFILSKKIDFFTVFMFNGDERRHTMPKKRKGHFGLGLWRNSRLFNQVGHEAVCRRGFDHEDSVFSAFAEQGVIVPDWFRFIGRGTEVQDLHEGIDFVIMSDVGKLFLQVKSSPHFVRKFKLRQLGRRYRTAIAVVMIDEDDLSTSEIRARVLSQVGKMRKVFLAKRPLFEAA
jgi:hypothetical protein